MEKIECISCKQEIPLNNIYVQFPCPECDELIARCEKCRTLSHTYVCGCDFKGP
jgi:predicted RNA-binding Zn-ribbon protein involved in translation (DUF1610 family)